MATASQASHLRRELLPSSVCPAPAPATSPDSGRRCSHSGQYPAERAAVISVHVCCLLLPSPDPCCSYPRESGRAEASISHRTSFHWCCGAQAIRPAMPEAHLAGSSLQPLQAFTANRHCHRPLYVSPDRLKIEHPGKQKKTAICQRTR